MWTMACYMNSSSKSTPPVGEARWFWTRQACLSKALPVLDAYPVSFSIFLIGGGVTERPCSVVVKSTGCGAKLPGLNPGSDTGQG